MHMDWPSEGMTKSKFESLSPLRSQKLISKLVFKHEQSLLMLLKIGIFLLLIPFSFLASIKGGYKYCNGSTTNAMMRAKCGTQLYVNLM